MFRATYRLYSWRYRTCFGPERDGSAVASQTLTPVRGFNRINFNRGNRTRKPFASVNNCDHAHEGNTYVRMVTDGGLSVRVMPTRA